MASSDCGSFSLSVDLFFVKFWRSLWNICIMLDEPMMNSDDFVAIETKNSNDDSGDNVSDNNGDCENGNGDWLSYKNDDSFVMASVLPIGNCKPPGIGINVETGDNMIDLIYNDTSIDSETEYECDSAIECAIEGGIEGGIECGIGMDYSNVNCMQYECDNQENESSFPESPDYFDYSQKSSHWNPKYLKCDNKPCMIQVSHCEPAANDDNDDNGNESATPTYQRNYC